MECNLLTKQSTLTTISENQLARLQNFSKLIILDSIEEMMLNNENILSVDLGYGTLGINIEDNKLRFKFVPSAKFEGELLDTIKNKHSPLESAIEQSVKVKLTQTYKDLM